MGAKEVVSQQRWEEYVGGGKRGGLTTEMGGVCRWGPKEVVSQQRCEEYVGGGKRGGLTTEM